MLQRIRSNKDEGFTLIELLIVIIILGILAAIVVFAIGSTRGDAVNSACKTNVKSIQLAAEAVKTKTGKYPATAGARGGDGLLATSSSTDGQVLKAWPGGSDATKDDLVFTYASGGDKTYTLNVNGKNLKNKGATGVTLTQDAPDGPVLTADTVEYACASN